MNPAPQPNGVEAVYVSWIVEELRREAERRDAVAELQERRSHWRSCLIAGAWVISVAAMYVLG